MLVSVIISERGEPNNLVWTLQGLEQELETIECEYIIVTNGEISEDGGQYYEWLKGKWPYKSNRLRLFHRDKGGIYQARNLGASKAQGEYLWFLDAHTLPKQGHYLRALEFKKGWTGILHMGLNYFLDRPGKVVYGYRWKPNSFWGSWTRTKPKPPEYRILMNGGANILIEKETWEEIGGYNPGLGIYGGGEPYTDLKVQMYGHKVKSHPDLEYYHLAFRRGYHWTQIDMWTNFMITSFALGGQKYFDMLYDGYYQKCKNNEVWLDNLNKAKATAMGWAIPDREQIEQRATYTVDEVFASWREYAKEHGHETGDWPT